MRKIPRWKQPWNCANPIEKEVGQHLKDWQFSTDNGCEGDKQETGW